MRSSLFRWTKISALVLLVAIAGAVAAMPGLRQGLALLWVYNANSFAEDECRGAGTANTIPFRFDRHVLVPAAVQGDTSLTIALDTGAPMSALIGGPHLNGLTLDVGRAVPIGGSGQGVTPTARVLSDLDLTVGAVAFSDITALLIPWEEMGEFFESPEQVYIHGILGYDLFSRYVVEIDFVSELLTLHRPDDFDYSGGGDVVPLTFVQRKPYLEAGITQLDGTTAPVKLHLDVGMPQALSLIPSADAAIVVPPDAVSADGRGLSGRVDERVSRVRSLRLGQHELRDVVTSFSIEGFSTSGERNGVIGVEALARFHVFIDYPHSRIILEPLADQQAFEDDMSGIAWIPEGEGFAIRRLRADSPAELAGAQVSDELVSIDGIDSSKIRLGELVERMRAGDGTEVTLELQRGSSIVSVVLTLRRRV